jgi:DHA1 family tetracycline resistance protein-like MFS transporter
VLIDMIAIGLIVPVLPPWWAMTDSPSDQAFWFGCSVTLAFGLATSFGAPVLGALSDRYGRRPVLLLGFGGLALSFFVTGRWPRRCGCWWRCGCSQGAMQANAAVANAYVADISAPTTGRAASACWARCSAWASSSGRPSAACWARSTSTCRSSWPAARWRC